MSAWFLLSAMGFYSVDPVSTKYIFGTPLFDKVTINLAGGNKLILEVKRESLSSIYMQSIELDGKPHTASWFTHADIQQGGRFAVHLSTHPDPKFGTSAEDRPKSELTTS
jgi:putative alpha-1,2-mannosidase